MSKLVWADSLFEKSTGRPVTTSESDSRSNWLGGVYKTDVNVVDSRVKFRAYLFSVSDFEGWMGLYRNGLAFSQYEAWIKSGLLSSNGIVQSRIVLGALVFEPGRAILPSDIRSHYDKQVPTQAIWQSLVSANVLDASGRLVGIEKITQSDFSENAFTFVSVKINTINLHLTNSSLEVALKNSLYTLILSRMQVLSVTRQSDTHYESRKSGFFEGLADHFAGNLLGGVFYPQQVQTDVHEVAWIPNFYVPNFFDFYRFGYNDHVFAYNQGALLLNGKKQQMKTEVLYMSDSGRTPVVNAVSFRVSQANLSRYFRYPGDGFWGWEGAYDRWSSDGEIIHFASLGLQAGMVSNTLTTKTNGGISIRNARSNMYLGYHFGFGASAYLQPFEIEGNVMILAQPDVFKTGLSWSNTLANLGVGWHLGQWQLGAGYQYIGGVTSSIGAGPYLKVSSEF